jgi:hypothetical protein
VLHKKQNTTFDCLEIYILFSLVKYYTYSVEEHEPLPKANPAFLRQFVRRLDQ